MDRVLISGITGFVGGNLKAYLNENFLCNGISRKSNLTENVKSYDEISVKDFDTVKAFIHLAGKAHDLKKTADDLEYFRVNTDLTKKMFQLFLKSKCEIFIYMSSVKAAADSVKDVLLENTVPQPQTPYGKSKLAAEEYILQQEKGKNKKVYILRPCMIHGPGNKGNLNLLYSLINKGVPYPLGKFKNKRSFLTVDNLCFVIQKLLVKNIPSGVYNISDDEELSTNEVVRIIASTTAKKDKIISIPKGIIRFVARLGDIFSLPLNTEKLTKLTENYVVSNKKLKKALEIDLPFSSREGLKKTIESFKDV